ncbi:hypothetical protein BJ138DRAFT_1234739 [Hygrophoropsis aurantiaca]|uniref:Uncharacterized protein n=1 Tax=Hygrophoropsis aurantiaca TaxID=72124 RepID=A0ACB7ZUX8_9AGAM|nr:hypothetical protein BJ138DRAFT_1234739 [Hygrophoropsis aurantiaca]
MFSAGDTVPAGAPKLDGYSDEHPIVLEQLAVDAFELFLSVSYGSWRPDRTSDEATINLLRLSDKYMSQKARDFAVNHIHERRHWLEPHQLITLALECRVKKFFPPAFHRLVAIPIHKVPIDVYRAMDPVVWHAVVVVQERLDEHRRIVACEGPDIECHASSCTDAVRCSDDWRQFWWNGMGRFLLDGRNPQPYEDAFERFQHLGSECGAMGTECWRNIMDVVKRGAAFKRAREVVEETALILATALIIEPFDMDVDSDKEDGTGPS